MTYKIKLQPGDHCRRDMGEDKYREVAHRFFDDGCPKGETVGTGKDCLYFGWATIYSSSGLYNSNNASCNVYGGRQLTYEQIMERSEEYKKLEQNYAAYKATITNQKKEPMTDDIWKDAPEGATHFFKDLGSFYKKDAGSWFRYNVAVDKWMVSDDAITFCDAFISRPAFAWHKNNELPPVGTECEYLNSKNQWLKASVLAIAVDDAEERLAILQLENDWGWCSIAERFRPIKSDREKAIEDIKEIILNNNTGSSEFIASALYDAGLRFMTQDTER